MKNPNILGLIVLAIFLGISAVFPYFIPIILLILLSVNYIIEVRKSKQDASSTKPTKDYLHRTDGIVEEEEEKVEYHSYLLTPKWKELRSRRLIKDAYTCRMCGATARLEVHHISYIRLGNEDISDLVTLCRDCHQKVHDHHGQNAGYYPILGEK